MPYEVKMPQLGMNQDSAVIVTWLKAPGDRVAEGEPIFEVETDKATMEVEAQSAGFLGKILAQEGTDVPVGTAIAEIVSSADEVTNSPATKAPESSTPPPDSPPVAALPTSSQPATAATLPAAVPPSSVAAASAPQQPRPDQSATVSSVSAPGVPNPVQPAIAATPPADHQPVPFQQVAPNAAPLNSGQSAAGRVLASPKAKRLALERGIDLPTLVASGTTEPIHAADLAAAPAGGVSVLSARAEATRFEALLAKSDDAETRPRLLAQFAASAWAQVTGEATGVTLRHLDGTTTPVEGAKLTLVDLSDTRLSAYSPAMGTTLSVAKDRSDYVLTLSFAEATLPFAQAVALLDEITARIDDPIRQLL